MKRPPIIVVQLIHLSGPLKGQIQEFAEGSILVGRHPSCHVRFPADVTVLSRKHAEIVREGNQFRLVDKSTNGTFVNGKRITETFLKSGDVLDFSTWVLNSLSSTAPRPFSVFTIWSYRSWMRAVSCSRTCRASFRST
ncbi:MAG: FHA domain-containing protein, partial [Deltaproteobacteria bacterium]